MNRIIVGVLLVVALLAALVYTTLDQTSVECSVCITYNGRSACETVAGPDRQLAKMQATTTACTYLSSGVTESIRCGNTVPDKVECTQ